jgi:hypothetical protein
MELLSHNGRRNWWPEDQKPAKLVTNPRLQQYVQDRLAGKFRAPDGREIAGPQQAPFKGRNKPHRGDRHGWSPEQIADRLQIDFPEDKSMRISHEAIYQALYIQIAMLSNANSWLPAARPGVAHPADQNSGQGMGTRQRRGDDHQTPGGNRRPWGARTLGG